MIREARETGIQIVQEVHDIVELLIVPDIFQVLFAGYINIKSDGGEFSCLTTSIDKRKILQIRI